METWLIGIITHLRFKLSVKGAAGIDLDDVADLAPVDDWEDQVNANRLLLCYCFTELTLLRCNRLRFRSWLAYLTGLTG